MLHSLCNISQRNSELMNALNAVRMTFETKRSKHWSSWCYSISGKDFDFLCSLKSYMILKTNVNKPQWGSQCQQPNRLIDLVSLKWPQIQFNRNLTNKRFVEVKILVQTFSECHLYFQNLLFSRIALPVQVEPNAAYLKEANSFDASFNDRLKQVFVTSVNKV